MYLATGSSVAGIVNAVAGLITALIGVPAAIVVLVGIRRKATATAKAVAENTEITESTATAVAANSTVTAILGDTVNGNHDKLLRRLAQLETALRKGGVAVPDDPATTPSPSGERL